MRVVVCGAGGVGGGIGGRLWGAGIPVVLVARGAHGEALRARGMTLMEPAGTRALQIPTVSRVIEVDWRSGDVVILATQLQDAGPLLDELALCAPDELPVVCAQNGLAGERMVARRGLAAHGMLVWLPAACLRPGEVRMHGTPGPGILDLGSWPSGVSTPLDLLADGLRGAGFDVVLRPDIMDWKRAKLLTNIVGMLHAVMSPGFDDIAAGIVAESEAVFRAAGLEVIDKDVLMERVGTLNQAPVGDLRRGGGSAWQSLVRGTGSEVHYLCGEITLLGALHGVPTPLNRAVQRVTQQILSGRRAVRSVAAAELLKVSRSF